jgi:hypothetical protein
MDWRGGSPFAKMGSSIEGRLEFGRCEGTTHVMAGLAQGIVSRCAAAAVALLLSGVPELVEPPSRSSGHRCHCPVKNGRHDCDCPLCHAEAARQAGSAGSTGDAAGQPACHKALAARTRAESEQAALRRAASGPCLTGTCGTADGTLRPPPAAERYTVPPAWTLALVEFSTDLGEAVDLVVRPLREPETPPPRSA